MALPVYLVVLPVYLVVFSSRTDHRPDKDGQDFQRIFERSKLKQKASYVTLTFGGLLETQKGLNPVWLQTASGSFSIFFIASVTYASVS